MTNSVGRALLTANPRLRDVPLVLTDAYKPREGTEEERQVNIAALKKVSSSPFLRKRGFTAAMWGTPNIFVLSKKIIFEFYLIFFGYDFISIWLLIKKYKLAEEN